MSDVLERNSIVGQIQNEISLLQQLYILAQTQRLVLENEDWSGLEEVVSKKECLVRELTELSRIVTGHLQGQSGLLFPLSAPDHKLLSDLKTEGLMLLDLIAEVEAGNRLRLEKTKSQTIHSSHELQRQVTIKKAYNSSAEETPQISQIAD